MSDTTETVTLDGQPGYDTGEAAQAVTSVQSETAEGTQAPENTADGANKRTARAPIDTGTVRVEVAEDAGDFGQRTTKLDTDPVAVAVRDAQDGNVNVLHIEAGKGDGVRSIARRAAARLNRGIRFDNRYEADENDPRILFKTGPKRQIRKKADEAAPVAEQAQTEPTEVTETASE